MKFIVTGGAGFIGSALIRFLISNTQHQVLNIDKLTYASNLNSLNEVEKNNRYSFKKVDICSLEAMKNIFHSYEPDIVMHLAAESHVDRSIENSNLFIETNIIGTYNLLEATREYLSTLDKAKVNTFRLHHISTDEVFGDLGSTGHFFTEQSPYLPSSPYSASKASADHLVHAWHRTYNIPVLITNCSNNYGPYQFPEKLIPKTILNALKLEPIRVYGNGLQIRDWLYVEDHVRALYHIAINGQQGENYNIGSHTEKTNLEVISMICSLLDELVPQSNFKYHNLITYVEDRPGHDKRYAIDASKILQTGWKPIETFESGMVKTINWYLKNTHFFEKKSLEFNKIV